VEALARAPMPAAGRKGCRWCEGMSKTLLLALMAALALGIWQLKRLIKRKVTGK